MPITTTDHPQSLSESTATKEAPLVAYLALIPVYDADLDIPFTLTFQFTANDLKSAGALFGEVVHDEKVLEKLYPNFFLRDGGPFGSGLKKVEGGGDARYTYETETCDFIELPGPLNFENPYTRMVVARFDLKAIVSKQPFPPQVAAARQSPTLEPESFAVPVTGE